MNTNLPQPDMEPKDPRDPRRLATVHPIFGDILTRFQPARLEPEGDPQSELALLDAMQTLRDLVRTYGAPRISIWLRNLAALDGQDIETVTLDALAQGSEEE